MNPPANSSLTSNSNSKNGAAAQAAPAPSTAPEPKAEKAATKTKPVTINIAEDVHRKLRIVAMSKGATTSGLVETYVEAALRKDLAVALAKLTDE